MVNIVQNSRAARFMPGAHGKPAQEPDGRVELWVLENRVDVVRSSTLT